MAAQMAHGLRPVPTTTASNSFNFHSTDSFVTSLSALAHDSLQGHIDDCADAHRWIDSFFQKLDLKGPTNGPNGSRPAMSELMKTPGRKRTVGANSTNHHAAAVQPSAAQKDPLATLLFPAPRLHDKENDLAASPIRTSTPKRLLSPSNIKKPSVPALSPMRFGSPRPAAARTVPAPLRSPLPATAPMTVPPEPVIARDFVQTPLAKPLDETAQDNDSAGVGDLSNVVEEDEENGDEDEDGEEAEEKEEQEMQVQNVAAQQIAAVEEEKADLSIIGEEEEEEEEEQTEPEPVIERSDAQGEVSEGRAAKVSPRSEPTPAVVASLPVPVLSPQSRSVSGASSVAPDADDDETVPLNDGPSALRSLSFETGLSSSLPASANTRTPGGTSARFAAVGSYSAAKIGMGSLNHLGSSPPPHSTSTFSGAGHNSRISSGGAHQLNFVGLPKKSMGLGLGLGRNWNNSSTANTDSQGSSQGRQSFATTPAQSSFESAASGSITATGAVKRKSLTGLDAASKMSKASRGSEVGDQPRSKIEQLQSRMQIFQARNSVAATTAPMANRMSTAGIFNSFPSTSKTLPGSTSAAFGNQTPSVPSAAAGSKPVASAPSTAPVLADATTAIASAGIVRRPSVMERVKSFEHATTTQDQLNPPSPSKIPSAFNRATSPAPLSPRGLASPTFQPSSPRPVTRSATSGLPLSTFGSPKMTTSSSFSPMMGSPRTIPSSFFRSPPVNVASSSNNLRAPPAPIPAPATLPLAAVSPPRANVTRLTTPPGSPPAINFHSIFQRLAEPQSVSTAPIAEEVDVVNNKKASIIVISDDEEARNDNGTDEEDDEDDYGQDEAEDEEELSIRPVGKSSTSSADQERLERAEMKAIAERAREIEEQEAEREREEESSKRLPSLPVPQLLTKDDEDEDENDEDDSMSEEEAEQRQGNLNGRTIVKKATKENLQTRTSPSKIVMPGTFGAALVAAAASNQNSPRESEVEDNEDEDEDDEQDENDRTTMSMISTATSTFNFGGQGQNGFKPIKPSSLQKQNSVSSLASSVSSTSALGLNQSIGNGVLKKSTAAAKAKAAQNAAAAAKKEKEDAERKRAMRDLQERRVQAQKKKQELEQKKQETERRAKAEELEKKRKERDEAVAKAKASAARFAAKQKAEEENSKKRKMEMDTKVPLKKPATQASRPMTASSSSHRISSLATSQGRPVAAPAANALAKSGGASSMIGQKFMSNQIRLPESSSSAQGASRPPNVPSTTVPKPFGLSTSQGGANRPPTAPPSALRAPPSAHKPEPEPYQELPEIDSEYSDSDDEAHEKKVAAFPRWAQSPVLTHQLLEQRKINPDDIFGPIPSLSVADMFRNSQSTARLRVRTSSARWEGTDDLTRTDMERYHKAMGFRTTVASTSTASAGPSILGNTNHET
ncbi:uncharacterized protein JCM15063_003827 [Sporobolomyces koalae]|uniref:uncharacterized protein n=1 Tax=Sporobolomyces koalae TaxID=500713 RepID=UPI003174A371